LFILVFFAWAVGGYGARPDAATWLVLGLLVLGALAVCGIGLAIFLWQRIKPRINRHLRTRLTVSHVLVVTLSLLVFSALMSVLYIWVLNSSGVDYATQFQSVVAATVFVLLLIGIITLCSIVVAMIASRFVSRRLTRQIEELEQTTESIAAGRLDRRVAVLTEDELGSLAVRFNALAERLEELDRQR